MSSPLPGLAGVLPEELDAWLQSRGHPRYRADQILGWLHRQGVLDAAEMANVPQDLRQELRAAFGGPPARVSDVRRSADGTRKLLVALDRGGAVETVLIPEEGGKLTQCLSTQVGCAFRCAFCLSGSRGLGRSLGADEVLAQVHVARSVWHEDERLSNIVLMGSGEPLANYEASARALRLLTSSRGLDLSTRRVTLSTIGLPKGIRRLGEDFGGRIGLAVSLHGPDDETRAKLLPKIAAVPIDAVIDALIGYPLPKRRRITIEYTLVRGVNDEPSHARALVKRLARLRVKVNLIPFNPHAAADLAPSSPERIEAFQQILIEKGLTAIVRRERGADIGAACGQLVHGEGHRET